MNAADTEKSAGAPQAEMSFLDHVEELRWRILKSLGAITVASIPCGIYWKNIFNIALLFPLRFTNPKPHLIFTTPSEGVVLSIQIAIISGLIISSPVIFYQLWKFISPGLYKNERQVVLPLVFFTSISFLAGIAFSYVVLPFFLRFLVSFGQGTLEPFFKAGEYIGFVLKIALAFGLVFELPVVAWVLTRAGIITPKFLVDKIRYAIVVIFIVAAVLTPPDVLSQLVMAVPLVVLYIISIGVSRYAARDKKS